MRAFLLKAALITGTITWHNSKPDSTPKKPFDVGRLASLGWRARPRLAGGLTSTIADLYEQLNMQLELS